MKRLVICCDGTWNTPDESDRGIPAPTNVTRLAEAVLPRAGQVEQLAFYHPGVGTSGTWLARLVDGYTGQGVAQNILQAYRFLVDYFEPGDRLFLFGFSRGAFTVRSLAGLVRCCGILRRDQAHVLPRAFRLYRSRSPASHPRLREATLFRRTYAVEDVSPIEFIGVWDTVGSLGNPLLFGQLSPSNRFHDTDLSTKVRCACQALAIDEKRRLFRPALWHQQPDAGDQRLEQLWFPGVHCNVGGGYTDPSLSDLALEWLTQRAIDCGLALAPLDLKPRPTAPLRESRTGLYRLLPAYYRPIAEPGPASGPVKPTRESLHWSVAVRYRDDLDYRPRNLERYYATHPGERPLPLRSEA